MLWLPRSAAISTQFSACKRYGVAIPWRVVQSTEFPILTESGPIFLARTSRNVEREPLSEPWLDADDVRQASRVGVFTCVMLCCAVVFIPVYALLGDNRCVVALVIGCASGVTILLALRLNVPAVICGNGVCATVFYVYTALAIYCGGRGAPTTYWYVTIPVLSLVMCGTGWAIFWTACSLTAVVTFNVLNHRGVEFPAVLSPTDLLIVHLLGLIGLTLCFFALAYLLLKFEKEARRILHEANHWLQLESSLDALTRVANRRCFDKVLEQEWQRHLHQQLPLTIVLIDLDYFKEFNDIYGHLAGDKVLRRAASAIQAGTRCRDDIVARFGGEEFVVILPKTCEQHVPEIVERMREELAALNIQHVGSTVSSQVTISVGTATTVPTVDQTRFELLRRADKALYRAKAEGRDRAVYANDVAGYSDDNGTPSTSGWLTNTDWDSGYPVTGEPITLTIAGQIADRFRPMQKRG